ncbi:MAG TPA: paclitaxel/taxanoid biosynthesis susceptibility protein TS1 [Chlamydiae bacterium]|nr:paclitaxel/taxanoid biosynthesis susceptibility protein TS1 [Chlamydiota bacterium]
MQKLVGRDTYTPMDTPLVRSNCDLSLNREETLSVSGLKTPSNNPEVDYSSIQEALKAFVYVISKNGEALMPCSKAKARKLLKEEKALIVSHKPFTIKLVFKCENQIQKITLGIDPGYENIGLSAISEKNELFSSQAKLRTNISKLLAEKKMYRRQRRSKLWYRKPRFLNRKKTKSLPPSLEHKLDSHLRIVKKIISFIPISKINVEVANFDIQKIKNPQIESSQYQRGDLYGYQNLKAYLVQREQAKCQLCSKKSTKGNSFRLHHIIPRKEGGTNKPNNLSLLHEKCHDKLHSKKLLHLLKKNRQFKPETFMSIIRWKLAFELKKLCSDISLSFGYLTKVKRNSLKLEKDHHTDAFVIANGSSEQRIQPFSFLQKRKNNRSLQLNRKGLKLSIRRQRYKVQPKDEVQVQSKKYEVIGVFNKGNWLRVKDKTKTFNFPIKKIEKHYYNNGWQFIPSLKERVFLPLKG